MALVKNILKNKLDLLFDDASMDAVKAMLKKMKEIQLYYDKEGDVNAADAPTDEEIAREFTDKFVTGITNKLATAIDEYIKSATVITNAGQSVTGLAGSVAVAASVVSKGTGSIK